MTDETIDCFNCGRPNPAWAQVCRSCGVPMRHGVARTAPSGPIPTDRESLISIGAVVATIAVAVVIGVMLANLNPVESGSLGPPTPSATPTPEETQTARAAATTAPPSAVATATPVATPALPGTIAFGTGITDGQLTGPTDTFTPDAFFAHVITMTQPFGVGSVGEQVVRVAEDGTWTEVVAAAANLLTVDPAATNAGVVCCRARDLTRELGPGNYLLRVFRGEELIAQGRFILVEG